MSLEINNLITKLKKRVEPYFQLFALPIVEPMLIEKALEMEEKKESKKK